MSSNIEWTDETWNPLAGCTKVSEGCRNCYAMKMAQRIAAAADVRAAKGEKLTARQEAYRLVTKRTNDELATPLPQWNNVVVPIPEALEEPYGWKQPRRVFVNSMSDLFHEDVPFKFIAEVFTTMAQTSRHTYQVLTKRPKRLLEFFEWNYPGMSFKDAVDDWLGSWLNVWFGVSVENQEEAEKRIPILLQVPAAVRFLSCEPLLGRIDLVGYGESQAPWQYAASGLAWSESACCYERLGKPGLGWVIAGGESGTDARPNEIKWTATIIEQCHRAGIPCFHKQVGAHPVDPGMEKWPGELSKPRHCDRVFLKSNKGGDVEAWPKPLQVREFPKANV